jgi:hypothetical protein
VKKRLWILRTFNVGLFYATLLIGFGSLLPGHWIPGSGVLSILFPCLLFPHLIMILIWARFRPQHMLKNLIALALLFFPVMAQLPVSAAPEQTAWKVASYNVRAFTSSVASPKTSRSGRNQRVSIYYVLKKCVAVSLIR